MSKNRYIFNLKNNFIKRVFLWIFKKKLNTTTYKIVCRGRHPNRKELFKKLNKSYLPNAHHEVPIKHAKTIAVYLRIKARRTR